MKINENPDEAELDAKLFPLRVEIYFRDIQFAAAMAQVLERHTSNSRLYAMQRNGGIPIENEKFNQCVITSLRDFDGFNVLCAVVGTAKHEKLSLFIVGFAKHADPTPTPPIFATVGGEERSIPIYAHIVEDGKVTEEGRLTEFFQAFYETTAKDLLDENDRNNPPKLG